MDQKAKTKLKYLCVSIWLGLPGVVYLIERINYMIWKYTTEHWIIQKYENYLILDKIPGRWDLVLVVTLIAYYVITRNFEDYASDVNSNWLVHPAITRIFKILLAIAWIVPFFFQEQNQGDWIGDAAILSFLLGMLYLAIFLGTKTVRMQRFNYEEYFLDPKTGQYSWRYGVKNHPELEKLFRT